MQTLQNLFTMCITAAVLTETQPTSNNCAVMTEICGMATILKMAGTLKVYTGQCLFVILVLNRLKGLKNFSVVQE